MLLVALGGVDVRVRVRGRLEGLLRGGRETGEHEVELKSALLFEESYALGLKRKNARVSEEWDGRRGCGRTSISARSRPKATAASVNLRRSSSSATR